MKTGVVSSIHASTTATVPSLVFRRIHLIVFSRFQAPLLVWYYMVGVNSSMQHRHFATDCTGCQCNTTHSIYTVPFNLQRAAQRGASIHHRAVQTSLNYRFLSQAAFCGRGQLIIPQTQTEFGKQAFASAGPSTPNSLPANVKLCIATSSFRAILKKFIFRVAVDNDNQLQDCLTGFRHWRTFCMIWLSLLYVKRTCAVLFATAALKKLTILLLLLYFFAHQHKTCRLEN